MAGYNGRNGFEAVGNDEYINATAFNNQITRQRQALNATAASSAGSIVTALDAEPLAVSGSFGVAKSNSGFFSQFDSTKIMERANFAFTNKLEANADGIQDFFNPDFRQDFNPWLFKSYESIKEDNMEQGQSRADDKPGIGIGPNLNSPGSSDELDNAMAGQLSHESFTAEMEANFREGKGYGWYDRKHKTSTIGGYLQNKYSFYENDTLISEGSEDISIDNEVHLGERIDVGAVDYSDDTQNT